MALSGLILHSALCTLHLEWLPGLGSLCDVRSYVRNGGNSIGSASFFKQMQVKGCT